MFDIFLEKIKKLLNSRLIPIVCIYLGLFAVLVHRLFVLQIVEGQEHAEVSEYLQTNKREIKSTRGNIYDRNGELLAYNELSYSVMLEDSSAITSNDQRNKIIHQLITIIENNGDTLDNEFFIVQNSDGSFEFTISGTALTRFKKTAFTYVLEDNQLTEEQVNATAEDVYKFLKNGNGSKITKMFNISDEYSVEETLKIMGIRYALLSNYPKYLQITVASNVSDKTVAAVMESSGDMPGVSIAQHTHRVYEDSKYFAHILGYTGLISASELESFEKEKADYYNATDIIGKTGIEKEYESYLGGKKGQEIIAVNNFGKIIDVVEREEPIAGNDVYLTIDKELQIAAYNILEKQIAGILVSKLQPDMNYGTKGESASDILTPIYEVYYALIDNNIIDINSLDDEDATDLEKRVYEKFNNNMEDILKQLDVYLDYDNTVTNDKAGHMKEFLDYFYEVLISNNILMQNSIPSDDAQYKAYKNGRLSLSAFLKYALSKNWIDLGKLNVGDKYYTAKEHYDRLTAYGKNILRNDSKFNKMIYRNLVFSYKLSGTEICLLLFDQGVLKYKEDDVNRLKAGAISPYQFMINKLKSLEITPAMLALDPYSGSLVITDVNSGDVLAMVTYPSYDNNKFADKIDSAYFSQLLNDKSLPMYSRPTQEIIAPGSVFKMVTAAAALEEGVVTPYEEIRDLGIFEKISHPAKCHRYPGTHGSVNVTEALKVSCNYYFYEVAYRLGTDTTGRFRDQIGLSKLAKYAEMFGLGTKSGVELYETNASNISNEDAIRSSIGQGNHVYTPVQLSRYITTIANRGTVYDLTILDKIVDKDGQIVLKNKATVINNLSNFKSSTWDSIQNGLYSVANTSGGSVYRLYNDLGITVAGKTGTSQVGKSRPNNALFVSYAPFENPEISVTAVIPNGHTSGNAAELTKYIYTYYYNLGDKDELVEGEVSTPINDGVAFSD